MINPLPEIAAADLAVLHARLVAAAERDGLLDVAYRSLDSPVGSLLLAATPTGLVRVAFAGLGQESALAALAAQLGPRILHAPKRLDPVVRQLEEYFSGTRRLFDLALDLRLVHGFRRDVVAQLQRIGYGHTQSYGEVAAAVGSPRAVRAVGTACALNPVPIVLPCHRVVRSDGAPGQYAGGVEAKRLLLSLEAS